MADVKGDLAGLSQAGELTEKVKDRAEQLKLKDFQCAACPLVFWMVATFMGTGLEPTPSDMARGMGDRKCVASYSLLSILSRISAQPAVLTTSTFKPCCL